MIYPSRLSLLRSVRSFLAAALLLVISSVGAYAAQAPLPPDAAMWEQQIVSIAPNTIEGARTMQGLLKLDPQSSLAIVTEAWPKIASPETRLYLFNMLQEHPRVLDIMHLAVVDPSLYVQNRALQVLEMYSFENFAEDFTAYQSWRAKQAGRSVEDTIRESCRDISRR